MALNVDALKLGKLEPSKDPRNLKLASYMKALPPTPPACDWTAKVKQPWGMMLNDNIGDCAVACCGHLIQVWSANVGKQVTPTDAAILAAYEAISGYKPNDPSTDIGCVETAVLNYWRHTGIAGNKVAGFVQIPRTRQDYLRSAIYLMGGAKVGAELPLTARDQLATGAPWTVTTKRGRGAVGSWGGHSLACSTYDAEGMTFITWGQKQRADWAWVSAYMDEDYAIVNPAWFNVKQIAPNSFNLAALLQDLQAL